MSTVLITGANRGLGLEFARQYAADGWRVLAACRKPSEAVELKKLSGNVTVHGLDVADPKSIEKLAVTLADEPIDLLLNNAGIYGPQAGLGNMEYGAWARVLAVNVMAPHQMTAAFLSNVEKGQGKRIVMISSLMGSIADNASGGSVAYRSSKAALNQVMKTLALELRGKNIVAVTLHPGWVKTDMGGANAPLVAKDSVAGMRKVIAGLKAKDSGRFLQYDGKELPW